MLSRSASGFGREENPLTAPIRPVGRENRLPREVWVAALTQQFIRGNSVDEVVGSAIKIMDSIKSYQPDIICLPEVFHAPGQPNPSTANAESSGDIGFITRPLADFARENKCYIIAPIYTMEDGRFYNAAVLIDRSGRKVGEYRKIRPTISEIEEQGVTPGPFEAPVFETDFGRIGIQICFDIEWPDGWQQLRAKGAEIVFWPSAFSGGRKVNTMAWQYGYPVVSSTGKGTTKICDVTGNAVAESGHYNAWGVCAPLNLEKALVPAWPYAMAFRQIHARYGDRIHTYTLHEEEMSVIESRDPGIRVADILKEFNIKTREEQRRESVLVQQRFWK